MNKSQNNQSSEIRKKLESSPKFYVINMKRSVDRLKYITQLFNSYGIKYQIVEAIDGKNDNLDKMCTIKHKRGYHMNIENGKYTDSILATMISHLKAIKTFVEDKTNMDDYAIIAEDDIAFDFCQYWNFSFNDIILSAPNDWEVIQLVYGKPYTKDNKYNVKFSFVRGYGYFATAYLIKRSKAKEYSDKFLKNGILQNNIGINHGKYIADYFVYDYANTYTYIPSLFTYRDNNDSYIHPTHLSKHVQLKNDNRRIWMNVPEKFDDNMAIMDGLEPQVFFLLIIVLIIIVYYC
jgi:hypothetical protein